MTCLQQLSNVRCNPPRLVLLRSFWHADCLVAGMADENYLLVLLQIICLLVFSWGVVVLTQHPEWFGA